MKKIYALLISAMLLLVGATVALGAIHDSYNFDFFNPAVAGGYNWSTQGGWFYTEKDDPIKVAVFNQTQGEAQLGFEAWKNDFTFIEGTLPNDSLDNDLFMFTNFRFNYLTKSGFFVGFSYASSDANSLDSYNQAVISPGYAYFFGENGYVALSLDYTNTDDDDSGIVRDRLGYDLDAKFYGEKFKFVGQYYLAENDDSNFDLLFDYKLLDTLVLGAGYGRASVGSYLYDSYYKVGLTWTPEFGVFDAYYMQTEDTDGHEVKLNGMFNIDEYFTLGLGYDRFSASGDADEDVIYTLKGAYKITKDGTLSLSYDLPRQYNGEDFGSVMYLRYNAPLKTK